MSKEFMEMLQRMNVHVYNLSTGVQIIAQLIEAHETAIEVKNVLEIKRISLDGEIHTAMIPYVPFGITESLIAYRSNIVTEASASLVLKKKYCDSLLLSKLDALTDQDLSIDDPDADEGDNDFDWSNLKDQYPNRNWNN